MARQTEGRTLPFGQCPDAEAPPPGGASGADSPPGHLELLPLPPYPPDAYLITDESGVIRELNKASEAKFHRFAERLLGMPLLFLVEREDRRVFLKLLGAIRRHHCAESQVLRFCSEPGFEAWVDALPERRRERPEILWILRDLAQVRATEHAMRARDARIHSLLGFGRGVGGSGARSFDR